MSYKLKSILLVDDDDATNFINRKILSRLNIAQQIHVALNGKEAIEFLENQEGSQAEDAEVVTPQLILLDINMPVMDGWEFMDAYHLLPQEKKAEVIVVMLSTSGNPDDIKRAQSNPEISGYNTKPLHPDLMLEIIEKHFPTKDKAAEV
ncbi:response regulator [Algoriphagus vanfongensis]|uniref:response regulator n=1 Tax=Algoriphagus vanfongensis TaxID=426371 RepID=UPI000428DE82|nr:response regulator [Algoriphagus vanfongensis]